MRPYPQINYVKLQNIIRIMQELQFCDVLQPNDDMFIFHFYYNPTKTSIDKSSILRKLKSQLRK